MFLLALRTYQPDAKDPFGASETVTLVLQARAVMRAAPARGVRPYRIP